MPNVQKYIHSLPSHTAPGGIQELLLQSDLIVCSHWTTPRTIPRLTTIIMSSTVTCRALHTAPRPCYWCHWLPFSSVSLHISFSVSLSVNGSLGLLNSVRYECESETFLLAGTAKYKCNKKNEFEQNPILTNVSFEVVFRLRLRCFQAETRVFSGWDSGVFRLRLRCFQAETRVFSGWNWVFSGWDSGVTQAETHVFSGWDSGVTQAETEVLLRLRLRCVFRLRLRCYLGWDSGATQAETLMCFQAETQMCFQADTQVLLRLRLRCYSVSMKTH